MSFLKNRTVLGVICIVLALAICFGVMPLFNSGMSKTTHIIRAAGEIKAGEKITDKMVQTVTVGSYNLPSNVLHDSSAVIGKYAACDMIAGDDVLTAKITEKPESENSYLYHLDGTKQAMSVTIKSFANGLSGKLISGDIVSVVAPDYKGMGETVIPPELKYVEVIGVTASTGYDTDTSNSESKADQTTDKEKQLPSTVTLLVTPKQSEVLAKLETDGQLHLTLVYRGAAENSAKFIKEQDDALKKLYTETTANGVGD